VKTDDSESLDGIEGVTKQPEMNISRKILLLSPFERNETIDLPLCGRWCAHLASGISRFGNAVCDVLAFFGQIPQALDQMLKATL
jgi:hypothetical protein